MRVSALSFGAAMLLALTACDLTAPPPPPPPPPPEATPPRLPGQAGVDSFSPPPGRPLGTQN